MKWFNISLKIVAMLGLLMAHSHVLAATVEGVRLWQAPDSVRLVFDLSAPVTHKVFTLSNPERLVVDIDASTMGYDLKQLNLKSSPIKQIRHGSRGGKHLRIVLDMARKVNPRSFVLKAQSGKPDRLVIDFDNLQQKTVKTVAAATTPQGRQRDIIVAISAGHGGEDPGAIGPRKLYEKNVVLKIAKHLEQMINQRDGFRAHMIRDGDYFIPLKLRRNQARKVRADLFIAIHADAFTDPRAKGASVFALSLSGASSESARVIAERENEADNVGGVGSVDIADMGQDLAQVIVDLSMTATLANSLDIGGYVLKEMGRLTKLHKKHVEQAGFLVLKSPDVPSILVETGFISNPEEARKLSTASYRKKMAKAIFTGVEKYYLANPPEGTKLAKKHKKKYTFTYYVANGDTLSGIARRYGTSVSKLKKLNKLSSTSIRIGQKLSIPR